MGTIAGAFATSHILMAPDGVEAKAERVFAGMREIGRRVASLSPDLLVLASSDHLMNFKLDLQVPFIVGVAEEYTPFGDMGIPKRPFRGHREFAEAFVRHAAERGFDLAKAESVRPDHGVALPAAIIDPAGRVPVVPLYVNVAMSPPPRPARVWALAEAFGEFVATERPPGERVVVIGSGGLSHWICMAGEGEVNEAFDRHVIDAMVAGRGSDLAALGADEILMQGGNGGLEIMNWIFAAGCLPGRTGERIYYEPIPEWLTGMGGVALGA